MAVFGFQLCFTLIAASFLQKLSPIYSLGRWLLCNGSLTRFCHPSNEELKKGAGKKNEGTKGKNRRNGFSKSFAEEQKTFKVSKNVDLVLEREAIRVEDSLILKKYTDYQWLVDYTLCGLMVYAGTDLYNWFWKPDNDFNISTVWMLLSVWFAVRNLTSIVWLYTKLKVGGEVSMSIAFALFSFVLALGFLISKTDIFAFDFEKLPSSTLISLPHLQLFLAVCSAILGGLFVFPAIRMAQMYVGALAYSEGNIVVQALLHVNFFAPALISLSWIKPILNFFSQDPRTGKVIISQFQVEIFRLYLIAATCLIRVGLFRVHLQAYLNLAHEKFAKLRKESGMILNTDLQRLISQVYYYLGVVATQYLSPMIVLLCFALCYKTAAGFSWLAIGTSYSYPPHLAQNLTYTSPNIGDATIRDFVASVERSIVNFRSDLPLGLGREVFSYVVWWCATNWFVATCVGYFYHSYLTE